MSKTSLFSVDPVVKESPNVIVPAFDITSKKKKTSRGLCRFLNHQFQEQAKENSTLPGTHPEKHETIHVRSYYGKRIDQTTLLKIANSLELIR